VLQPAGRVRRSEGMISDDLTARLAADVDAAFPALVDRHAGLLYGVALRLLRNPHDAEEVAQEALERAHGALHRYPATRVRSLHLRAWLVQITLNAGRTRLRARRPVHPLDDDVVVADGAPGPHARAVEAEGNRRVAVLLAELPERHRLPVALRHVEGLSYEEIAEALDMPVGTVKANVHRGLRTLRAALDREEMTAA
jgi:RNA polymerase sigma factor (sigma-70 family)